jgi:Dolichyl-phosphate-mannose-protein mannosyltransferase
MDRLSFARRTHILLGSVATIAFAALVVYSQTLAFSWDEGFHLVAADMIQHGKRPYIDFCFPQTPLNAYVNAAVMTIFGDSWRPTHILALLFLVAGIAIIARFVHRRFPVDEWKLPAAAFSAILIVSSFNVVAFGVIAQAYAICLLFSIAAFRISIAAAGRKSVALVFASGLCAGIAAGCTVLTAASVAVIFVWTILENTGRRWRSAAAFLIGAAIPFVPVAILFAEGPQQTWFNVIQYQALYRRANWESIGTHDTEVFFGVLESPAPIVLILLALAGFVYALKDDRWDQSRRREMWCCAAITLASSAELWTAHPTFERYFLLTVPYLAVPAAAGMYFVSSRLYRADRPWRAVCATAVLTLLGLASALFSDRDSFKWRDMEKVAAKVLQVTPEGATLSADELTYFLTRRPVPDGWEFGYAHELNLPGARAEMLHIISQQKLDDRISHKTFATVESCSDDDIARQKLESLYDERATIGNCSVFWNSKKGQPDKE